MDFTSKLSDRYKPSITPQTTDNGLSKKKDENIIAQKNNSIQGEAFDNTPKINKSGVKRPATALSVSSPADSKKVRTENDADKTIDHANKQYFSSSSLKAMCYLNHKAGMPFMAAMKGEELIKASEFTRSGNIEKIAHRVYGESISDSSLTQIIIIMPRDSVFSHLGPYKNLIINTADAAFFEDLSLGADVDAHTDTGRYMQAVSAACAAVALRFGWIMPKREELAEEIVAHMDPELITYGFAFAMQHAAYKQRGDILKYCLDQGGDPLCGHRVEDDLHTVAPLEVACIKNNNALVHMILKKLSPERHGQEIRDLFSEEHGWDAIPAPIEKFLQSQM